MKQLSLALLLATLVLSPAAFATAKIIQPKAKKTISLGNLFIQQLSAAALACGLAGCAGIQGPKAPGAGRPAAAPIARSADMIQDNVPLPYTFRADQLINGEMKRVYYNPNSPLSGSFIPLNQR